MRGRAYILAAAIALCCNASSRANPGGTINGNVRSREDGKGVAGVNITLGGTVLGASSDSGGHFMIPNVPQGSYTVTASIIGYRRKVIEDVQVRSGESTPLEIELEAVPIQTEPVVVTAARREQSLQEVPVSVSSVDAGTLSFRNTVTVDDALRFVPGVNMTQGQVNIRGSTGFSLGVGSRVLLLVDGLPLLSGDTGEIIWESLPVSRIERIEVVKGASSALYGSSALGGVINIITKSAPLSSGTRVRFYGGLYQMPKYSQWRWTDASRSFMGVFLSHEENLTGNLSLLAHASRTLNDGYRRNDYWKRWNLGARSLYTISPYQSLTVGFELLEQQRGNFLFWKDFDHALEPPDEQLGNQVHSTRWDLTGAYKLFVSNRVLLTVKTGWFHSHWADNIPSIFDSSGSHSRSDALNAEIQGLYQPSSTHTITFGLYGVFNAVASDTIFGDHTGKGGAIYAQDEIRLLPEVLLTLGGRYDAQQLEGANQVSQFNPKLGATYNPLVGTTLRASLGRGFRAPAIAEVYTKTEAGGVVIVPNRALAPERSWSFEVGATQVVGGALMAELALFRNEFWDLIEPTFQPDGRVRFDNVTRARIEGAELTLRVDLLRHLLTGDISYTVLYPEDVTTGELLKYRPRHMVYVSPKFTLGHFQAGVDFRFLSRIGHIDDEFVTLGIVPGGDERVPVYVTDARFRYEWSLGGGVPMAASFQVNNIFQYYYVELIGNMAPLRNYVLTLETSF